MWHCAASTFFGGRKYERSFGFYTAPVWRNRDAVHFPDRRDTSGQCGPPHHCSFKVEETPSQYSCANRDIVASQHAEADSRAAHLTSPAARRFRLPSRPLHLRQPRHRRQSARRVRLLSRPPHLRQPRHRRQSARRVRLLSRPLHLRQQRRQRLRALRPLRPPQHRGLLRLQAALDTDRFTLTWAVATASGPALPRRPIGQLRRRFQCPAQVTSSW